VATKQGRERLLEAERFNGQVVLQHEMEGSSLPLIACEICGACVHLQYGDQQGLAAPCQGARWPGLLNATSRLRRGPRRHQSKRLTIGPGRPPQADLRSSWA